MCSGSLSGPAYMKKISDDWRGLSKEEQGIFKEEAASIRMQPLKGRSRADTIKTQLHIIDTAVSPVFSFWRFFYYRKFWKYNQFASYFTKDKC